jgi:hypothetical protein
MKRVVFALIFAAGCSYADTTCGPTTPTDPDASGYGLLNSAVTLVGGTATGCLSEGDSELAAFPTSGTTYTTDDLGVTWTVTKEAGYYQYQYKFANATEISHVVLGLTNLCTTASIAPGQLVSAGQSTSDCIYNMSATGGFFQQNSPLQYEYTGTGTVGSSLIPRDPDYPCSSPSDTGSGSNPCIPLKSGSEAITLQPASSWTSGATITFDSKEAPVLEDIYIRDSNQEAWNSGATVASTADGYFVATPGVPEPAFYGLLALGMSGLFLAHRFGRKRSSTI